jgi:tetratricopeptide (TPR) repeat protein
LLQQKPYRFGISTIQGVQVLRRVTTAVASLFLVLTSFAADPADPLIAQGRTAMAAGDHDKAIDLLKQAVARSPKNANAHYCLGEAYGDAAQSASIFSQASLAGKCRDEFEAAVALDPNHLDARASLIDFYLLAPGIIGGSESKAVEEAQEIRKRDALRGHLAFVRIYNHQKKPELVRAEYLAMVKEQPNLPKAHFYYGGYLIAQKQYDAASAEFETSIKLDASYMPGWFQIGHMAALTGKDTTRGEEALQRYLNYKPDEDEPGLHRAHYWLGGIYEKLGKKAEAKSQYQASLKLNANQKEVQEALVRVTK